jgi:integrase
MANVSAYTTAKGETRYRVRYRKPDNSQTDKRGFRTKREAREWASRLQVGLSDGVWVDPSKGKALLGPLAEVWFSSLVDLRPTTLANYRQQLDKHVLPTWGNRPLGSIQHVEVQAWVTELYKTLSESTTRQVFMNLRSILDFAIQNNNLKTNPCDKIRLPKLPKTKRPYLTHGQVLTLAEACPHGHDIVLTLAYTGLRFGELVALRVKAIDFIDNYLNIDESVSEIGGKLIAGPPKNGESRRVPFPEFLKPLFLERIQGKQGDDRVFGASQGGLLRLGNFRRRYFNPAVTGAQAIDNEFPSITPHDLRHTTASLAVSAGANIKSLQRMLGHAKASITLDTYADLFDDDLTGVSVALNNIAGKEIVGKMWAKATTRAIETPLEMTKTPA